MTNRRVTDLDKQIGRKLEAARRAKGLTQADVGRAVGVTFQQVQKYETGTNRVAVSTLVRLCHALELDAGDFLPRLMSDGRPAPDPFAAMGATIGGYELARIYAALDPEARSSILSVAKAIASAKAVHHAAQAA